MSSLFSKKSPVPKMISKEGEEGFEFALFGKRRILLDFFLRLCYHLIKNVRFQEKEERVYMKRENALPELLSPAGDMEALYAAVAAGADAVYVGGKRFGARAFAKNFDGDELERAARYCHLHNVKLYVTVNTLVFDRETDELADYAEFLYKAGVDAVIAADLGAIRVMRERVPNLEIHASTQMSVHNTDGADMAVTLGCKRVVTARELPYSDICEIVRDSKAEIEVFLHGALCVCHSGQCLFSSLVGGRSGNRGECAQPCRLPYNGKYPLSLLDLSLAGHIPELIDSGVASLKIEGRMKSADYVYEVTKIYRKLLDQRRCADDSEREKLAKIFSRGGGFTDSYFTGKPFSPMTGVRSEADKTGTKEISGGVFEPVKKAVRASAVFRIGESSKMSLSDGVYTVSVLGDAVGEAISVPLTEDGLRARLSKMGNTFLTLSEEDIEIELDDGANLSPGAVNALRRAAADAFESGYGKNTKNETEMPTRAEFFEKKGAQSDKNEGKALSLKTALFLDGHSASLSDGAVLSDFDAVFAPLFSEGGTFTKANGVYLPPVLRNSDVKKAKARLSELKEQGVSYALVGNIAAIFLAKEAGLIPVADTRLNITNRKTKAALSDMGIKHFILSAELDIPKARDIGGAVTAYGRIPLMLTERCFVKENFSCDKCGKAALTDRRGKRFPILREYEHRNLILNSEITYMADKRDELARAGLSLHFIFSTETKEEVRAVLSAYKKGLAMEAVFRGERPRRIGMREPALPKKK